MGIQSDRVGEGVRLPAYAGTERGHHQLASALTAKGSRLWISVQLVGRSWGPSARRSSQQRRDSHTCPADRDHQRPGTGDSDDQSARRHCFRVGFGTKGMQWRSLAQ